MDFKLSIPVTLVYAVLRQFRSMGSLINGELATLGCEDRLQAKHRIERVLTAFWDRPRPSAQVIKSLCQAAIKTVDRGESAGQTFVFPMVPNPALEHPWLFFLQTAADVARLGYRVVILSEESVYQRMASLGAARADWPSSHRATARLESAMARVERSWVEPTDGPSIEVVGSREVRSNSIDLGTKIERVLAGLKLDRRFVRAVRDLATVKSRGRMVMLDVQSAIESFVVCSEALGADYLAVGRDRVRLYSLINSAQHTDRPVVLSWGAIPDRAGDETWSIGASTLAKPFSKDSTPGWLSGGDPRFRKWARKHLLSRWTPPQNMVGPLSKLQVSKADPSVKLDELCLRFLEENKGVLSVSWFGDVSSKKCPSLERASVGAKRRLRLDGDIDLLFVVEDKVPKHIVSIEELLRPFGSVVHHPDFYRVRLSRNSVFEVVVLPRGSKVFSDERLSCLTGASVFLPRPRRYQVLAGDDPVNLISVPTTGQTRSLAQRQRRFKHAHFGSKFLQAALWPMISNPPVWIDRTRIARFLVMGAIWVHRNEWLFDQHAICDAVDEIPCDVDTRSFAKAIIARKDHDWEPPSVGGKAWRRRRDSMKQLFAFTVEVERWVDSLSEED